MKKNVRDRIIVGSDVDRSIGEVMEQHARESGVNGGCGYRHYERFALEYLRVGNVQAAIESMDCAYAERERAVVEGRKQFRANWLRTVKHMVDTADHRVTIEQEVAVEQLHVPLKSDYLKG